MIQLRCGATESALGSWTREFEELDARVRARAIRDNLPDESAVGALGDLEVYCLYLLARAFAPSVVVECGVNAGRSSAFILGALTETKDTALHSIDWPIRIGDPVPYPAFRSFLPAGREPGWIVPEEMKSTWRFHRGRADVVLPTLLLSLGSVGLFVHDAEHTVEAVTRDLTAVLPVLAERSCIFLDDVHTLPLSFVDEFATRNSLEVERFGRAAVFFRG